MLRESSGLHAELEAYCTVLDKKKFPLRKIFSKLGSADEFPDSAIVGFGKDFPFVVRFGRDFPYIQGNPVFSKLTRNQDTEA